MKILFIVGARDLENKDWSLDYQCDCLFHGLVSCGHEVTDTNYIRYLSQPITDELRPKIYGRGFTIGGKLPDRSGIDRSPDTIRSRIEGGYYDLVVYGSIWRCSDYMDTVRKFYPKGRVLIIDGEDHDGIKEEFVDAGVYFKREQPSGSRFYPISFAVPEEMFRYAMSMDKTSDFAPLIPWLRDTYVYDDEDAYYKMYASSRFAFTCKKASWDSLRHYEIVASGSLPVFTDFSQCPSTVLTTWPRHLQGRANDLAQRWATGDRREREYEQCLVEFVRYGREHLTTRALANYVLSKADVSDASFTVSSSLDFVSSFSPDTERSIVEIVEATGGHGHTAVVVGGFDGSAVRVLLGTGKVSRVYSIDDYAQSSDDPARSHDNLIEAEHRFDALFGSDDRVVKVRLPLTEAISSGSVPDYADIVYICGITDPSAMLGSIRATCNMCDTMGGDGYGVRSVRDAIELAYGRYVHPVFDGSWFIRDPRRKLCVVTPLYGHSLSDFDLESLRRGVQVFAGRYDMSFVCPESYDESVVPEDIRQSYRFERFEDRMFEGLEAYSKLCASRRFYDRFMSYTHILIYQTDGYVFRDDLFERWMKYDYVGAPWCWQCKRCKQGDRGGTEVGNGGVSLRRVSVFKDILGGNHMRVHPEDMALVLTPMNRLASRLIRPDCKEALLFSVESQPNDRGIDYDIPSFGHKLHLYDRALFERGKRELGIQ